MLNVGGFVSFPSTMVLLPLASCWRAPHPPARNIHSFDGGHISPTHAKRAAPLATRPLASWMGGSSEEVRWLARSSVYARLAGTARYLVAFRCPHLLHFQPLITRTRPRRSSTRGRRTQRAWVWRVCSLHRVQWIIRVSTSPIGGTLYHGLVGWQCRKRLSLALWIRGDKVDASLQTLGGPMLPIARPACTGSGPIPPRRGDGGGICRPVGRCRTDE